MAKTYTVKHYWNNPRNNTKKTSLTKSEAIREAKLMYSETETGECSHIIDESGKIIASRYWHQSKLSWK